MLVEVTVHIFLLFFCFVCFGVFCLFCFGHTPIVANYVHILKSAFNSIKAHMYFLALSGATI